MRKKKIAVIFGGPSDEHEVSLKSASQVMSALDRNKYEIFSVAITKNGYWLTGEEGENYMKNNIGKADQEGGVKGVAETGERGKFPEEFPKVDLILPVMHGTFGEDGNVQGVFELFGLPYAFSGVLASSLAMNKKKTKIIVKSVGLKIAKDMVVIKGKKYNTEKIISKLGLPIVVKPGELGSSIGMSLANSKEELESGIKEALKYGSEILLEQFVKGRELTVTVMSDKTPKALSVIEIIPKVSGWFNYRAKYETGGSQEVCPAEIPEEVRKKIQRYAVKAFKAVGCLDLARADFIWSESDDKLYFLEINTIPGMTATSLVPQAAKAAGMEFPIFLDKLIKGALKRQIGKK